MAFSSVPLEKKANGCQPNVTNIGGLDASLKASENKFALRAIGLASVVGLAVLGVVGSSSIGGIFRSRGLFLRGHKDDAAPTPAPPALGERCGADSYTCAEGSFCAGSTCIPCGNEFDDCCVNNDATNFEEYYANACQGNLKCAYTEGSLVFSPRCLKCWANGDTCGLDSTCCDADKTCVNGQCVACGKATEACCFETVDYDSAENFSVCTGSDIDCSQDTYTCETCAKENEGCTDKPCCGSSTGKELTCDVNDICVKCGGGGEPICSGDTYGNGCDDNANFFPNLDTGLCESSTCGELFNQCCYDAVSFLTDTECKDSRTACLFDENTFEEICAKCGASGEDCDDSTPCCSEDQSCDRFGKCTACGGDEQPCCGDGLCNAGLSCNDDFNVCTPCGDFADGCCQDDFAFFYPENNCNEDTLACDENFRCADCVEEGADCSPSKPCCQDGTTPLVCGGDGKCSECGKKNQPCCILPYLKEYSDVLYCSGALYCGVGLSFTCLDSIQTGSQRLPSPKLPQDRKKIGFPKSIKRQHYR